MRSVETERSCDRHLSAKLAVTLLVSKLFPSVALLFSWHLPVSVWVPGWPPALLSQAVPGTVSAGTAGSTAAVASSNISSAVSSSSCLCRWPVATRRPHICLEESKTKSHISTLSRAYRTAHIQWLFSYSLVVRSEAPLQSFETSVTSDPVAHYNVSDGLNPYKLPSETVKYCVKY